VFVVDPTHPLNCVYFVIFILVLQIFDGNILGPRILGNSTGLTGFWVIFAITLFGGLFGVPGMIVGVPIFAVFYAAVKSLVNAALLKKDMPCETSAYMDVGYVDDEGFHEYVPESKIRKPVEKIKKNADDKKDEE
jgi:predicted PurR-regulated permease PerM